MLFSGAKHIASIVVFKSSIQCGTACGFFLDPSIAFIAKGLGSDVGTQTKKDHYEDCWSRAENRRKADDNSYYGGCPNIPRD